MEVCLSYPLSPFPPALTYPTGEMYKLVKAILAKKLTFSVPNHIDIDIINGFHLLHNLGSSVTQTFGKISEFILKKICNTSASEMLMIFNRYLTPSIKDIERLKRLKEEVPYAITCPSQSRPTDFNKSLTNTKFKEALVH